MAADPWMRNQRTTRWTSARIRSSYRTTWWSWASATSSPRASSLSYVAGTQRHSRNIHFIPLPPNHPQTLLGTETGNLIPPLSIGTATFNLLRERCTSQEEINLLQTCYQKKTKKQQQTTGGTRNPSSSEATAADEDQEQYVLSRGSDR